MTSNVQKAWRLAAHDGPHSLRLDEATPIEKPGAGQVLVKIRAVSLNYRDIMVSKGQYPPPYAEDVRKGGKGLIPVSDGAGEIVQVGDNVTEWKVGDRVLGAFHGDWLEGDMTPEVLPAVVGGASHGVLQQYRVFNRWSIVKIPQSLSYEEASTLPCAGLTAWHALREQTAGRPLGPEDTILTIGTGGVSLFAIQIARASGARVIVTSSSDEKLAKCKELGATDTINYQKTKNWGEEAFKLTNGRGVDHVIELGGFATLQQSLAALKIQGQVHIIGFIAGSQVEPYDVSFEIFKKAAHVRSYLVGHKKGLERFVAAIENNKIKPVIDRVFTFDQAKDAYEYLLSQKHVGKIVIKKTFLPERERKPAEKNFPLVEVGGGIRA
ncbi:hypothetical protein PROFUN_02203 [Planoprotostelium fungivorum]|uniref:Enoyl reductase (ER) domain-containing protein n=1 Tax=Planoprotostelium fungivorum TaxID=1890364 RepID=A0A2P6NZH5_9EUKA|nr:hypothetical protein PROFUN_02203 [Planoprotostelium fungivorum]